MAAFHPSSPQQQSRELHIAPLKLGGHFDSKRASVVNFQRPQAYIPVSMVTPPLTPQTSDEDLYTTVPQHSPQPQFSEYWRAFYGYYPSYDEQSATVTLPLNAGDLVLVHSIHDNGWADGTLLSSGIRGWFPTNYCEPYDHESIRNLLRALTNFFDIVRAGADGNVSVFCNQDYMRGLVAGVRFLLVGSILTSRPSPSTDMLAGEDWLPESRRRNGFHAPESVPQPQGPALGPQRACENCQSAAD